MRPSVSTAPVVDASASSVSSATDAEPQVSSSLRRTLRYSLVDGLCGEVVTACTTGATLTAWALYLQGTTLLIGLLTALPFLAQSLHLPAAMVIERIGTRRVAIVSWAAARMSYAALIPLPFLSLSAGTSQKVLFAVAAVASVFTVLGTNAWTAWMGELVPTAIRGRYYGRRYGISMFGGALGALMAGLMLDHARKEGSADIGLALSCVAGGIAIAGLISTWCLLHHEKPPESSEGPRKPLSWSNALAPFRDPAARPVLRYQVCWNLAVAVSAPFLAMHMAVNLKMGFIVLAAHAVLGAAFRLVMSPIWGRLVDALGARPVLVFCSFGICLLPFVFLWPTADNWTLVWVDAAIAGTLWSGHAVAMFSLPLRIAPKVNRSSYVAVFAALAGLGYGVSSVLGGTLGRWLPDTFTLFGREMVDVHALLLISLVARTASAFLSLKIREPDSHAVPVLVDSLSKEVGRHAASFGRLATAPLAWGLGWARR